MKDRPLKGLPSVFIDDQKSLEAFIERAKESDILAIDTEFLREKTYYAKLCLLQMATRDEIVLVDPLRVKDLSSLAELFVDESITKLFHAGSQDIEILSRELGCMPSPVFDTQIAAALLGQTQQVGYAALVQSVCGVSLKKTDSYTDWSRRPLSESQQDYAADDVRYLPAMYASMKSSLEEKGRLSWLADDFAKLVDPKRYEVDPRERFVHLKRASQLSPRQLSAAREVAAWREVVARKRNLPRKWIMSDEQVVEACRRGARSIDELMMVRGLSGSLSTQDARHVVSLIVKGLDADERTWPRPPKPKKSEVNVDAEVDVMTAVVRMRAKENDVAFQTLSCRDDLVALARGHRSGLGILEGWRRELVGDELVALLEGNLQISFKGGRLKVTNAARA